MAANNSTLQIEVVSVGIQETVRKLDSLGNAAGRNEAKVKLLTDSLGLLMVAQDTAATKASQHAMMMNAIASQLNAVADSAKSVSISVNNLTSNLSLLSASSDRTTKSFERKSSAGGIVNSTIHAMTTAAIAYLGINFAKGIVEAADSWRMMQARLKLATGSMEEARQVQGDLFETSQRLRVPLDDIGKLYTRMSIPMQRMGKDAKETAEQVEFVALALKLNGATAAEASSVMLQYSQSVNAGRLNGAEFSSVAEGAPGILRAIEAELKATGKWSESSGKSLKQLGADGEITFAVMNAAAQRALPEMRKSFAELPLTVDGAIQRIKNAWLKAMGEMGEDTGIGIKLAKAIGQLEVAIPAIRDALATTFTLVYENFGKIATVIEAIIVFKFAFWLGGVSTAMWTAVAASAAMATGVGAAGTAIATFGRGMAFLAGPVGIFIALLGVGAVQAYRAFKEESETSEKAATATTVMNTTDRINMIQKEIDKLDERNGVAKKAPAIAAAAGATEAVIKQQARVNELQMQISKTDFVKGKGSSESSLLGIDMKFESDQLAKLITKQDELVAKTKVNEDHMLAVKVAALNKKFDLGTENKAEELARVTAEAAKDFADLGETLSDKQKLRIKFNVLGKNLGVEAPKADPYADLRASLKTTRLELELNIAAGEKATAADKIRAQFDSGQNKAYATATPKGRATLDDDLAKNKAYEETIALRDKMSKADVDAAAENDRYDKKIQSNVISINAEIEKTREQIAALTESKTAVKEMAAAQLEAAAQNKEIEAIKEGGRNDNTSRYDNLMAEARAMRELAAAKVELGKGQDEKEAFDALDKLLNPKKAADFAAAFKEACGDIGGSIGMMVKGLNEYEKTQKDINEKRKMFSALPDSAKQRAGLAAMDKQEALSKLHMYGTMASAAKGYFAENTVAYKIAAGVEKTIRAVELAETLSNFAIKEGLLAAFTGLFVASKATEAGVQAAATGGSVAAAGTEASAWGITAVARAISSLPPPFNFIAGAAVTAALVALGVSMSGGGGGGGGGYAEELKAKQEKQNTGTVLGDSSAKSESISKAMASIESNSNIGLVLTSNMLSSLRGIEASMQGLASAIFQVSGMTTGKNFGIDVGTSAGAMGSIPIIGKLLGSIFGGGTTTSIQDTGLKLNGTTQQFQAGQGTQQYADVHKETKGGWFSSDSQSDERQFKAANGAITATIGRVFASISSTITDAAVSLGASGDAVKAAMAAYVIDTEVSFKDLKGDELKTALENMFSSTADTIARSVFGGYEAFQSAGEGYYQTIIRVATGSEQASNALEIFGINMVDIQTLTGKTGDIASGLVRQSIMVVEAGTSMADIMKVMGGSMNDLVDGYKSLLDIRDTMRGAGLGQQVSINTIRGAGGVSELQTALQGFVDGFYTDAEKQQISFSKLRAEFGRLNVTMPTTKDGFKTLVSSMMAGDAASQELAGRVLLLGGAFSDAFTMSTDAIDKAKSNLSDAYDRESSALQTTIDKMKGFTDSLTAFKATLITGDLSTKSTSEKYATAKATYADVSSKAMGGDVVAIAAYEKAAADMLKFSRDVNASGAGYTADYERVLAETEALRAYTSTQVDVATASLDALKEQVKGLLDIKASVLTVTEAIVALHVAMVAANPNMAINGSHANGLSNVPFDGYIAELHKDERVLTASENRAYNNVGNTSSTSDSGLVAEVKALREELRMLREEQREQTASVIGANYDATERSAQVVVAGNKSAMEDASYFDRTKNGLV